MFHVRALKYPDELPELRHLIAQCHPTRRQRPDEFFFAHPHLVAVSDETRELAGYAAFTINSLAGLLILMDCGVSPDHRGHRIGRALMLARLRIGGRLGCRKVVGAVAPDNGPMRRLTAAVGLTETATVPAYYSEETPPRDGIILVGGDEVFAHAGAE
jgi:GNAT superfamily N-acetyltransferase